MLPIFTLNARDSVMLDVVSQYFELSDAQMQREIRSAHDHVVEVLARKGVAYAALRGGLVPQTARREMGFVFDSARIDNGWYGRNVAERMVPLFDRRVTCSILVGDLILANQDVAFSLLQRGLVLHKPCEVVTTSQLYCVYVNNLSDAMVALIHQGLLPYEPYVGYIDATYSSKVKNWLSMTLVHAYLKHKDVFICGHEDDRDDDEDVNMHAWPLEELDYGVRSLQSMYFDLLLAYKIERAVYPGFESDIRFALAAISDDPRDLSNMTVEIEEAKARYLRNEKKGSLSAAGLDALTTDELSQLIRSKLMENYIYHLRFGEEHGRSLFNLVLEFPNPRHATPSRLMGSFDYSPERSALRLVTLF